MRKIAMLVLAVSLFFTACGKETADQTTEHSTKPSDSKISVAVPFTQAMLDAIQIANKSMTTDELRQICIAFMRAQLSIPWTPNTVFTYDNKENFVAIPIGKTIGGMPYITQCQGTFYNFLHFYDEETGTFDAKSVLALPQPFQKVVCNQCSGATYWAWARVCNSMKWRYTYEISIPNGAIPVGPYNYDPSIRDFYKEKKTTTEICEANGKQTMFESYAKLLPADGVVHYTPPAGHVEMITVAPVVVRNPDDHTIDGSKSYLMMMGQGFQWKKGNQSNGQPITYQNDTDKKWTFDALYKKSYIPFTFAEFIGQSPVEEATIISSTHTASITVSNLSKMSVTANYPISYTTVTVRSSQGENLYTCHSYTCTTNVYTTTAIKPIAVDMTKLQELANGTNTVEITARVSTGEILTAYTGTLAAR